MSTDIATKQKQEAVIIKTPMELQSYLMNIIESPKFAERYGDIIDKKSMFMAVQSMQNIWWQISKIQDFDFTSVVTETIKAGCYGWTLDGITGHAYLVPYGNQVKLQPGYKGLLDLVHRADQCESSMEAVYDGDEYEYRGRFKEPRHVRSKEPGRRSKPLTHAYVVAGFRSGIIKCFSWTVQECIEHRDRYSKGWKAVRGKPDKEKNHPWCVGHPGFWVMCCKTVLTNAVNRGELPISMKDLRGKESMLSLADDEDNTIDGAVATAPQLPQPKIPDPMTFDSPPGFSDPLHDEEQEPYTVDAEHSEPTSPTPPQKTRDEWLAALNSCDSVRDCEFIRNEAARDKFDIAAECEGKQNQIRSNRGHRRQTELPGE